MTTALTLVASAGDEGDRILTVTGEIDMSNAAGFGAALDRELADGAALTVDLTGVTYLDSAGVAALFDRATTHDVRLTAPRLLDRVLRVSGLAQVAKVVIR
ncbi:STAS domain-containing protein [Amycolatopsis sp. NBC_01488]|uniref:STAS domain-containing protein n=1 Tax=Amycolatopsis sp. NBC_01488 TaxID=2903563 RepID=UPI002E2C9692|nr:STAS domain-containing protein [Amycolatopsis sp. NBC_01488]